MRELKGGSLDELGSGVRERRRRKGWMDERVGLGRVAVVDGSGSG